MSGRGASVQMGLPLYNGLPPHVRWSDTSAAAALSMVGETSRIRRRVLWYVAGCTQGATCDEVEVALDLRHQTASARIRELVLLGCLEDTHQRRRTRSGRTAVVWWLTQLCTRAWLATVLGEEVAG